MHYTSLNLLAVVCALRVRVSSSVCVYTVYARFYSRIFFYKITRKFISLTNCGKTGWNLQSHAPVRISQDFVISQTVLYRINCILSVQFVQFYGLFYFAVPSSSKTLQSDNESNEMGGNEEIDQVLIL